jgi:hypothetical protein
MIEVTPSVDRRRAFAQWARVHDVRTSSAASFGVPLVLFPDVPEALLIGALIDDQQYTPSTLVVASS